MTIVDVFYDFLEHTGTVKRENLMEVVDMLHGLQLIWVQLNQGEGNAGESKVFGAHCHPSSVGGTPVDMKVY